MNVAQIAKLPLALVLFACSSAPSTTASSSTPQAPAAGAGTLAAAGTSAAAVAAPASREPAATLTMPALEDGYRRFMAAPVDVPAGGTDDWIQWVAGPMDQDYDVVALKGAQSKGGHHALMLSIGESNPAGFTRKYTERDQLTSSSVGGIGAEGNVAIPEGVVFRLKKGRYLAIQSHYLNVSDQDIKGETYIDIKMTPRNEANTVAGHFASTSVSISLPPKVLTTLDVHCDIKEDLHILRMTNHMHYAGLSTFTEYTDPAGALTMLKKDDTWSEDWALTPNYDNFPVSAPLLIPAGSKIHTQCTWNNATDKTLTFPEEMCVFATIILGEREISCIENKFSVVGAEAQSSTSSQPAGAAGAAAPAAGAAGAPAAAGAAAPAASGACTNTADQAILEAPEFQDSQRTCGSMCLGLPDTCATECFTKNTTLTPACASCNGAQITCAMMHCIGDCTGGFMSASCKPCLESNCGAAYHACAGL